jgi:acetoin utilization protein AcuC
LTLSLIRSLGLLGDDVPVLPPEPATDQELECVHDPAYVAAVKRYSHSGVADDDAWRYGLGTDDVPIVRGMHEAAALIAGSTRAAAEAVLSGKVLRAFSLAGGLHHARRAEAAGFCVYSDLAVAIDWMKRRHGVRVMYVDYDAHHGDGVQQIFFGDPDVLTVSFHESGSYLFPGTGFIDELGEGEGHGYSVNVPLDPHTDDASFQKAFADLVPALADAFRPDVIVLQNGCDSHAWDPLTHLRCTTNLYEPVVRIMSDVADRHCQGRIVATGGGGYAIYSVVPRAWTLVWAALRGLEAPDDIPESWLRAVRIESGEEVPSRLRDEPAQVAIEDRNAAMIANNERTVRAVRHSVLPLISGWGLAF